jgi:hypothetical protein
MDSPRSRGPTESLSKSALQQDWTKFVTIIPPNAVSFKENIEEGKGSSFIELKNKSQDHILFKVKYHLHHTTHYFLL